MKSKDLRLLNPNDITCCLVPHGILPEECQMTVVNWEASSYDFGLLSISSTLRVIFITESALRDIECIPSFTRNSANSG